jgi:hypothetical protein
MEFITVEQFKEQSEEVQKIFLDWWNPSVGDIFIFTTDEYDNSDSNIGVLGSLKQISITRSSKGEYRIPLFTEGQLRKFIEDKNNGKVESYYAWDYYTIAIRNTGCGGDDPQYDTEETNLLKAYWKVACMIAKEEVDG